MLTLEMTKTGVTTRPLAFRWGNESVEVAYVSPRLVQFTASGTRVDVNYPDSSAGRISWDRDGSMILCRPRALSTFGSYSATAEIEGAEPVVLDATQRGCAGMIIRDATSPLAVIRTFRTATTVTIRTGHRVPPPLLAGFVVFLLVDPAPYVSSG